MEGVGDASSVNGVRGGPLPFVEDCYSRVDCVRNLPHTENDLRSYLVKNPHFQVELASRISGDLASRVGTEARSV